MTDIFSKKKRSEIMSKVKGRDTAPEMIVRSIVHRMGCRFSLHRKELPGTPDIVLRRLRKIILVHGCFWHAHKGCKGSDVPKTNTKFWLDKFERNRIRDLKARKELKKLGWQVLVVWECETKKIPRLTSKLKKFLH